MSDFTTPEEFGKVVKKITKEMIYSIEKPEKFDQKEWDNSVHCFYRMIVNGSSASVAGAEYAKLEIIRYLRNETRI